MELVAGGLSPRNVVAARHCLSVALDTGVSNCCEDEEWKVGDNRKYQGWQLTSLDYQHELLSLSPGVSALPASHNRVETSAAVVSGEQESFFGHFSPQQPLQWQRKPSRAFASLEPRTTVVWSSSSSFPYYEWGVCGLGLPVQMKGPCVSL